MDGEAEIRSSRKENRASACSRSGFDGAIDRRRVDRLAVAGCPVGSNVKDAGAAVQRGFCSGVGGQGGGGSGQTDAAKFQKIATGRVEGIHRAAMLAEKWSDQKEAVGIGSIKSSM